MKVESDPKAARITHLSWDTEGGGRCATNLLRPAAGVTVRVRAGGKWLDGAGLPTAVAVPAAGQTEYRMTVAPGAALAWSVQPAADKLSLSLSLSLAPAGGAPPNLEAVEVRFAFNPLAACTTALASKWEEDGGLHLPAVIVAPDFGAVRLSSTAKLDLKARLEGSRNNHTVDLIVELPMPKAGEPLTLVLEPVQLPPPEGLKDKSLWALSRRGWFNSFQATAKWGDPGHPVSSPAGLLGNNVLSDPGSCSVFFYSDMALFVPEVAPGVSVAAMVRRTVEFWLDQRTKPNGEVICYWDYVGFLDANAGPLIAAWDYVEATGDKEWLAKRIEKLEFIADFLAKRDVDGDGFVEATQSGNANTLQQPKRSCAWFDAVNCGHKDGYTNAHIYRAWRCLAEMEGRLGRAEKQARYAGLADKLKAVYAKTLFNEKTGWLAWWKSQDGKLHDHASPVINGLAIEYGLVEPAQGREILARLRAKMKEAGFTRFDLGVPPVLVPIPRADYLQPQAPGLGQKEDGSDAFQQYQNGGITAGQVLHFIMAHYAVGEAEQGEKILRAMLERQNQVGFQNGAVNEYPKGIDWTTWDGKPCGYEGLLADSYRFMLPVLLREPAFRQRYYRPFGPAIAGPGPAAGAETPKK